MEKIKHLLHNDLYTLITALQKKDLKIVDILFDKGVKTSTNKKNELVFEIEEGLTSKDVKQLMILIDFNKANTLLGVLYTGSNKKPYKLVQLANVAGTKFIVDQAMESKLYDHSEVFKVVIDMLPTLQSMEATDKGLRALTTMVDLPRETAEMYGILHYEHKVPSSLINKSKANLTKEILRNPVTALLRLNTTVYDAGLTSWMSHSANILHEISYISTILRTEQERNAKIFNLALEAVDDVNRRTLVGYALTEHPDKITKLMGLIDGIKTFNTSHEKGTKAGA